jgi:hypothetical protein
MPRDIQICFPSPSPRQGRVKSFVKLLKQAEQRQGQLTDKCRFDPDTMSFSVLCIDTVLCGLASTARTTVKNMRDLPGGTLIEWDTLTVSRIWKRLE